MRKGNGNMAKKKNKNKSIKKNSTKKARSVSKSKRSLRKAARKNPPKKAKKVTAKSAKKTRTSPKAIARTTSKTKATNTVQKKITGSLPRAKKEAKEKKPVSKKVVTPTPPTKSTFVKNTPSMIKPISPIKKEFSIEDLVMELIEKGKQAGVLTYEEIMEFGDKHHLSEQETESILSNCDKENIELVTQEELDGADTAEIESLDEDEVKTKIGAKVKGQLVVEPIEQEEDEEDEEAVQEGPTQITDSVKSYLRDIGKIPLLNKKTETAIAMQIAEAKQNSINAISKFPFLHKEFVLIGDKLQKNSIALKDIIQFSEFDEDNLPKIEDEKSDILKTIKKNKKSY